MTLFGLVKHIHVFLDVSSWSIKLARVGNVLLGVFAVIVLIPFIYPTIFKIENYGLYLQYFRIWALLIFVYVLIVTIWSVLAKIKFSRTLLLAFSPLIVSGVWYAISFLLLEGYTPYSIESLVLISGSLLTLLLFGVIQGVRNNAIKGEKLRLEQEAKRLKELDHFKSRFYTNITHEFRTPLTVIRGMADQVKGQEKIKTLIRRNSDKLMNMINQLLNLSKLENHSLKINWIQGDVIPYLQYLTESHHSLAESKNLSLAFYSRDDHLIMDFDADKTQQILINLLSNAIKFTPEYGSVKVVANQSLENGRLFLQLTVQDTGTGISQEKQAQIFDRFYQADDSATRQGEGTGIGLAIVRELVHLLDGRIEVKSEVGKGSSFLVFLPIHGVAQKKITPGTLESPKTLTNISGIDTPQSYTQEVNNREKPLLLIIEDNADVIAYIISCLQQDYALHTAGNGKEGVEAALEIIPDVILCDVMMPEMDGFEVCRLLKSDRRSSHIPIILLTAKATQKDKIAGLAHGADAYLTKPFDKKELMVRLENLTALSQRFRERMTHVEDSNEEPNEMERREAAFLQEVNGIIEGNMAKATFDTNYLCKIIAMSRTQLHRKLKALTGQSTARYIRTARLQKAKILLKTSDMPIGEIALDVGYKDFSHFSKSFSKQFGMKPSETRK